MRRSILTGLLLVGVFVFGAAAAAGVAYVMWPHSGPARALARKSRTDVARPDGAIANRNPGAAAKAKGTRPGSRAFPADGEDLTPEERLQYRRTYRDERLADVDARLDAYATSVGWDADRTELVREVLIETTDGITAYMEQIDRGETTWEDQKESVRLFRYEQAAKIEDLLGPEFENFVIAMHFTRFLGDQNVRDKLQARQAPPPAAAGSAP